MCSEEPDGRALFSIYGSHIILYLFSFRESVQDYKIHMDMKIVKFA